MSEAVSRNGSLDEDRLHRALRQEMDATRSTVPGMLKVWSSPPPHQETRLIPPPATSPMATSSPAGLRPPRSGGVAGGGMKEVIAIIRPQQWSPTKLRLQRLHVQAFTHTRVLGRGRERGLRYLPRAGAARGMGVRYLPKRMISWVVEEAHVEPLVNAIIEINQTGQLGDGKIFVLPIDGAVRIRTGEQGLEALQPQQPFEMVMGQVSQPSETPAFAHASRE